jgi:SAM-dependent methyltransferase
VGDDPNVKVDLACDVSVLPFEVGSVDFIYAGHLIEHFYPNQILRVLQEWHRVLKPGGRLVVVTPDCGAVFKDYARGRLPSIEAVWQQVYGRIYDYDRESERHHIAFDWDQLYKMVNSVPWDRSVPMDFDHPPEELVPFMDIHISRGAYQLGIVLTK